MLVRLRLEPFLHLDLCPVCPKTRDTGVRAHRRAFTKKYILGILDKGVTLSCSDKYQLMLLPGPS